MSFPFFASNLDIFIYQNKIDINFIDEPGNDSLFNLINNQEYIIQISKDIYNITFKYLLANININILKKNNNNEKSIFYWCLINEYFEEAKIMYLRVDKSFYSYLNSILLKYILEQKNPNKNIEVKYIYLKMPLTLIYLIQNKRKLLLIIFVFIYQIILI